MGSEDEHTSSPRRWYHYLPLAGAILLILSPHPSLVVLVVTYHYKTLNTPYWAGFHLFVAYLLTFLAFSSMIVCVVRDPGPVLPPTTKYAADAEEGGDDEMTTLAGALNGGPEDDEDEDDDVSKPGRFCRKCWVPKPLRAHHCSICDRCVLKMDHHCPWLGAKCIGHRTYPSFVHFVSVSSLLALHVASVSISALIYIIQHPYDLDERAPLHILFLVALGGIFSLTMGSFTGYHFYLIHTNQTTIEQLSPFLLLRHMPSPLPRPSRGPNARVSVESPYYFPSPASPRANPPWAPQEHELNYRQRRIVQRANDNIRLYDIGWRKNWESIIGVPEGAATRGRRVPRWRLIVARVLWGGGAALGDGYTFTMNPHADEKLSELALRVYAEDDDVIAQRRDSV
ncbi:zf-DHHC-domain-containing protein [Auriculariales sp. MPI-PUGE-AT-0066]|nr:zf-DHHC-domain-containing protein [Auriculariales sp. MPI-PUGE-AT-0066]